MQGSKFNRITYKTYLCDQGQGGFKNLKDHSGKYFLISLPSKLKIY